MESADGSPVPGPRARGMRATEWNAGINPIAWKPAGDSPCPTSRSSCAPGALELGANERLIRFMAEAQRVTHSTMEPGAGPQYWPFLLQRAGISSGPLLRLGEAVFHGCSAGRGFVYIKPNGDVWPCPYIEVSCGNVREKPFADIWRTAPVFHDLRRREQLLKGQCGECEYRRLCGGCRGRAWAITGDYLAADPSCFIHPPEDDGQHRSE